VRKNRKKHNYFSIKIYFNYFYSWNGVLETALFGAWHKSRFDFKALTLLAIHVYSKEFYKEVLIHINQNI